MRARPPGHRRLLLTAFAAAALPLGARAASGPTLTPTILQCDNTYQPLPTTNHPTPLVRVDEQSAAGLKVGQRRLAQPSGTTVAMWRFDGTYDVTRGACFTGSGCPGGSSCRNWTYTFTDAETGSPTVTIGSCTYRSVANLTCTTSQSLSGSFPILNPVQIGNCPASTATLAGASGSFAITPSGPRPGTAANGLSAEALTLNGSQMGTVPDNAAWNLGPSYTLAAWVNPSTNGGRIVSQQGNGYWGMGIGPAGDLRHFDSRDALSPEGINAYRGSGLVGTGWHMVHVVRTSGDRRFFIDGRFVGAAVATSTDSFTGHPIAAPVAIGAYIGGSEYFTGQIDDVRVLNVALADDDVMLEWNSQIHRYSPNGSVGFSTFAASYVGVPANGTTGVVSYDPGETYTPAGRWIFMGQTVDLASSVSPIYQPTIDMGAPIPGSLTGDPTSTSVVNWDWSAASKVCPPPGSASVSYDLLNAANGAVVVGPLALATTYTAETGLAGPNLLIGRRLRLTDNWGSGLSASASVYTLANPAAPLSLVPVAVTTGSASLSWGVNSNPAYTRWLVAYSQDPNFATGVSTPIPISADFTGNSISLFGLQPGTTYSVRVQSYSGRSSDLFGGVANPVFVSTSFTTYPDGPVLTGTPQTTSSILWSWTSVPGAQYYKLFDVAGSTLYTGSGLTFTQGGLAVNTQYTSRIEALSLNGPGPRNAGSAFTKANDPTAPIVVAAFASSITYSWNGNGNPGYTFYEVSVTTDSTFAIVVATLSVNATGATASNLFPGTTYFAKVRSIDGSQSAGNFVAFASTRTAPDPAITANNSPPSAYTPIAGVVGQWQFDESTGTTAADSSGLGNAGSLTCLAFSCTSTPTWSAGPSGLGSAVSFSGLASGLVRVPNTSTYNYTGSLTIEAWAYPNTTSQPSGAGLVVRGDGGVENFALDVLGGFWHFAPVPGTTVFSTNTIAANQWTHLIGSYDAALGTATIYVNGRAAATVLGVPPRVGAVHDISIGNRQSGSTTYDRGFIGKIDSVRVVHRALSPAEALTEYGGSFVSTVTASPPNNGILIGLPPNAFGASATFLITTDPVAHGVNVTPAVLNAGLANTPTGYVLVPNGLVEIVPIVGGTAYTAPLGSSATVSMPYADAQDDNVIDGSNPPLAATGIRMFTLNTIVNRWEQLPMVLDRPNRRVTGWTPHFSVFGLFAPATIGQSLSQVRVYPVPWTPGSGDRFDAPGVTFDNLPVAGTIKILTLAGERVREVRYSGASAGVVVWDGRNDSGRRAASGVYFARVSSDDGPVSTVKFAIER